MTQWEMFIDRGIWTAIEQMGTDIPVIPRDVRTPQIKHSWFLRPGNAYSVGLGWGRNFFLTPPGDNSAQTVLDAGVGEQKGITTTVIYLG